MRDFRELQVWRKAHDLVLACYRSTCDFPRAETFGLTSQIRRSSASIAANIAEGCGRHGDGKFHRFLQIAMGSVSELDYHLLLSRDLSYLPAESYGSLRDKVLELKRMLVALVKKVDSAKT
jgi:four helix bundle protein